MRRPHNWVQLVKFVLVGGSGYAVNLAVFPLAVELLDVHHLVAATLAFLVAVMNNFWWNRHWTFGAADGHAGFQAARFFTVSVIAFLFAAGGARAARQRGRARRRSGRRRSRSWPRPRSTSSGTRCGASGPRTDACAAGAGRRWSPCWRVAAPAQREPGPEAAEDGHEAAGRLQAHARAKWIAIADRAEKVRAERGKRRQFRPTAYTKGPGRWQVSYFDRGREGGQVKVDDRTGAVLERGRGRRSRGRWRAATRARSAAR